MDDSMLQLMLFTLMIFGTKKKHSTGDDGYLDRMKDLGWGFSVAETNLNLKAPGQHW